MGSKEMSEPRAYPAPSQVVFDALIAGARQVGLVVTGADPQQGVVWADKPAGLMSWGENISIFVRSDGPQQTSVVVESRLKFGLVAWGAHKKNFEHVHRALDAGLAGARQGHGQQPYPQPHGHPQPGHQQGHPQSQPHGFPQQPGHQQGYPQQQPHSQPHGFPQQQPGQPQQGMPQQGGWGQG